MASAMYFSKHIGKKIDDTIDYVTNPNLLDNWYFVNPVNQRGSTSYPTGGVYTVDRWKSIYTRTAVELTSLGVKLSTTTSDTGYFQQYLENPAQYYGRQITISVLIDGTDLITNTAVIPTSKPTASTKICGLSIRSATACGLYLSASGGLTAQFAVLSGSSYTITAVKLELGEQQTLAHQDASGNWVLNEIPDYGEQLARCQRHQYVIAYTGTYGFFGTVLTKPDANASRASVTVPVAMRIAPKVTMEGNFYIQSEGALDTAVTGVAWAALDASNTVRLALNHSAKSSLVHAGVGLLTNGSSTTSKLIFDANL